MEDDSDDYVSDRNSYVSTNSTVSDEPEIFINTEDLKHAILFRQHYPPINTWEVSQITNMNNLFANVRNFNEDISNWDVSNVVTMEGMFQNATSFNQDISDWDVSRVTDMKDMFNNATSFNQDISDWDVSHVTVMTDMFNNATSFNQNISDWNVSNVQDMEYMFYNATSFNQDISSWNVSKVETMDDMFEDAISFNQSLESWNVPRLILFGAANSKLTKLFTLPPTLKFLDVTNCQLTTLPELHPGLTIYGDGNPFDQITHRQLYKFYHGTEAPPHYPAASPPGIPLSTSLEATRRLIMKYGEQTTAIVQDAVHDKSEIRYLMSTIHNMYQKIKNMEGLGIIHAHDYEMLTGLYNHCKINLYKVSLTFDNDKYAKLSNDVKKVMDSQPQPYEMYKLSMNNKTYFKEAFDITKDIGTLLIHMRNFYQQFKLINDSVERILKHYEGIDPHGEKVDLPPITDIPIPEYGILKYPINRQIAEQLLGVSKGISSYDIALQQHTKKIGTYKDVNGTQHIMYDDPYMRFNVLCIDEAGRLLYQGVERDDDEWQRVTLGGKHRKKTKRRKTKRSTRKR